MQTLTHQTPAAVKAAALAAKIAAAQKKLLAPERAKLALTKPTFH